MDGTCFDNLTRIMAAKGSRRRLLAAVAGLVGGAAVAHAEGACPSGQVAAAGGRCVCKTTGRPPVDGVCPCPSNQVICNGVCSAPPCCDAASCPAPGVCVGRYCCQPKTVCDSGQCGPIENGCGGTLNCGLCCTPRTTCNPGECGVVDNGCGGTLNCGSCCTPRTTCNPGECGQVDNGCGGTLSCGTCPTGCPPDCVSDACYTRACVDGVCQQSKTLSVVGVCNEEVCDPQVGWVNGPPKTCNTPGPCQIGPGVCDPSRLGCVYQSACATCESCVNGQCVDTCPPASPQSCWQNGVCNSATGLCEYQDTCGPCGFCYVDLTCHQYPDGTINGAGNTCCSGVESDPSFPVCAPGACPDWRDGPQGLEVCCGEWYGNGAQCCEAPNRPVTGTTFTKCCPPGTVDVCTGIVVSTCCDHPCSCTQDGCVCS